MWQARAMAARQQHGRAVEASGRPCCTQTIQRALSALGLSFHRADRPCGCPDYVLRRGKSEKRAPRRLLPFARGAPSTAKRQPRPARPTQRLGCRIAAHGLQAHTLPKAAAGTEEGGHAGQSRFSRGEANTFARAPFFFFGGPLMTHGVRGGRAGPARGDAPPRRGIERVLTGQIDGMGVTGRKTPPRQPGKECRRRAAFFARPPDLPNQKQKRERGHRARRPTHQVHAPIFIDHGPIGIVQPAAMRRGQVKRRAFRVSGPRRHHGRPAAAAAARSSESDD